MTFVEPARLPPPSLTPTAMLGAASPLLIALTGYGAPEQRAQALSAGFDLHIVKPVFPSALREVLGAQ